MGQETLSTMSVIFAMRLMFSPTLLMKKVKWEKERDLDQPNISRALAPKPLQEEIKRRILEKDWVTYQRRDKQVQTQPQEPPT